MTFVPIITYHAIGDGPPPLFTPISVFESHLAAFAAEGYRTLSLADLAGSIRRGEEPPEHALVLTFDDGYRGVAREAWPRLRERGFGGTVFLVSDFVGKNNRWPTQGAGVPVAPLMTWDDVGAGMRDGMEIGSHSRTHAPLVRLSEERARDEIDSSVTEIRKRAGAAPRVFAYPYGVFDETSARVVASLFDGCAGTELGLAGRASDPLAFPRVDAFYLTARSIARLSHPGTARRFRVRRALRFLKRRLSPDWR
jgi:peptidoglycan/xylan/chitin deacetylase (PgdA/CDA1 family)